MREEGNVRGSNTAATLWGSAAVGAAAGADLILEAMLATVFVLAASVWCRHLLGNRSWLVAGPGLLAGFVPSTLLTLTGDEAAQPLLTATAAVAVLVHGAARR